MSFLHRVSRVVAVGVAIALAACGSASPGDHPGRGVVKDVDPAAREITLDHEDIPGLMKAMKMTFQADPALLTGVEAGQRVEFRVRYEDGRYELTAISPTP